MRRLISFVPFIALVVAGCSPSAVPADGPRDTSAATKTPEAIVTDAPVLPDPTTTPSATASVTVAPTRWPPLPSLTPAPSPGGEVAEVYLRGPFV